MPLPVRSVLRGPRFPIRLELPELRVTHDVFEHGSVPAIELVEISQIRGEEIDPDDVAKAFSVCMERT